MATPAQHQLRPGGGERTRARRGPGLARGGLVVVAAAAALLGLGHQPLWFDEIASARASALPWGGLRTLLGQTDANVGGYYALLHVLRVLGSGPALLRLPSALATVGTVLLTERVGRRLLGRRAALVAAGLLAVQPFSTAYARDARPYALVALCCTAALLLGLRAVERPTTGRLAAYCSVAALAVCLHLYAVLAIGAYALALLPAGGPDRRRWLAAQLAVVPVAAAVLAVSLAQTAQLAWVPGLSVGRALSGLVLLCGGAGPALAVFSAAAAVALPGAVAPRTRRLLLTGLLLPVGALLAASLVSPTFVPRYLVATVPVQCLVLAAAGTAALRRRGALRYAVPVLAAAVALWYGVTTVVQVAAPYRYEDYRAASRALLAGAQPGDGVVYEQQGARLGLDYYLTRANVGRRPLPKDVLAVPGAGMRGFATPQLPEPAAVAALARFPRVWVVRHLDVRPSPVPGLGAYLCHPDVSFGIVALQLCQEAPHEL